MQKPNAVVLDVGFGTGTLTTKLYEKGCTLYGQDFSARMIELAKEKMPDAVLIQGDFSKGLDTALREKSYDFVISTYALHHLDYAGKLSLIRELTDCLNPGGRLLIGDVAFETNADLDACRLKAGDEWDEDEIYFIRDEMKKAFPEMEYEKISECAGLMTLQRDSGKAAAAGDLQL